MSNKVVHALESVVMVMRLKGRISPLLLEGRIYPASQGRRFQSFWEEMAP